MLKIGIGIITCNRTDFLGKCVKSMHQDWYDEAVIINDGDKPITEFYGFDIINNETNVGVCKSKNKALQDLLDKGCDYIFLIEDDMKLNGNVFEAYINAHKETGIHHFSFGYHGPANRGNVSRSKGGVPTPRKVIDYGDRLIALNMHSVGALCFYTRKALEDVGLFDEDFDKNNFEHVEHSYRLAKAGYSTPYWWWADLANSHHYISEQACSEENSSIRRGDDWQKAIMDSAYLFKEKHGVMPAWQNAVPDTPFDEILKLLKGMYNDR